MTKQIARTDSESNASSRIAEAILEFVGRVPVSDKRESSNPEQSAHRISTIASTKAAATAGTLAIPPGPIGWLTILPEMIAVWKIQAQLVADISAIYGRKSDLTQEQMIYCLFRHVAAQAVRDLVVRVGERVLIKRASLRVLQRVAQQIGVKATQRTIAKGLSRWVPIVGAVGVGGYAYFDTSRVGRTAIEVFSGDMYRTP